MSLSYIQMQLLLAEIKVHIEGAQFKIAGISTPNNLILEFQKSPKIQQHLLIGLNAPFQRFHLTKKLPSHTNTSSFLKILNKNCEGKIVVACTLLNNDRILALQFENNTQLIAELIPRRPNCYLLDSHSQIIASWYPSKMSSYQLPEKLLKTETSPPIENCNSLSIESDYDKQEQTALFNQQKQLLLKQIRSLTTRTEKNIQQRQQVLSQCQQWQQCHHQGNLLQSQLYRLHKGMKEVTIDDWENANQPHTIQLDPLLEPYQQAETLFKRSKKLRLGIPHAERMLQQAEQENRLRQNQLSTLEKIATLDQLNTFCIKNNLSLNTPSSTKSNQSKKLLPAKPYHTYTLANGLQAWVGKSAKDNDKLSFQHANGSDWWLHVRDYPGSHVVVRCGKNEILEGEALKDATELAIRFSKAKNIKIGEVALTQAKYLTRVKGVAGKVQLSKHKVIHHTLEESRWLRLKHSKVV